MINMEKFSRGENSDELRREVETMILDKLSVIQDQLTKLTYEDIERTLAAVANHPVFDKALDSLIAQGLVSRIGSNEYQITNNGVFELTKRMQK
jgi:predicted transcriptional regulator